MKACPEFEALLMDRAAGELGESDRLVVEQHLTECPSCAAEANALQKTLDRIALPSRSAEERAALASLQLRTSAAWRRTERRRSMFQGAAGAFLATAAAAALILVPQRRAEHGAAPAAHRIDPAVAALENWASPTPLGGALRELPLEDDEMDLGDEGEL